MRTATGQILELRLDNGLRHTRIACPANLVPAPGQYLLASHASDSLLPVSLFYTDSTPEGFITASPVPDVWHPGQKIFLYGPWGHGFALPASARRIVLIAFDEPPVRLQGLIKPALRQNAALVVASDFASDDMPDEVEVQPLSAVEELLRWADYAALDMARENLPGVRERLATMKQILASQDAQVLIRTPVPCGGVAECGVCAVTLKSGWKMACKEGPVFLWNDLY